MDNQPSTSGRPAGGGTKHRRGDSGASGMEGGGMEGTLDMKIEILRAAGLTPRPMTAPGEPRESLAVLIAEQERKRIRAAVARVESGVKPSLEPDPPPSRLRRTRRHRDSEDNEEYDSDEGQEKKPVRAPIKNWAKGNLLGAGAFGKVYLALNKDTGHLFAVKQIEFASGHSRSEKEMAALENELELLRGLWSPYIVGYLGTERTAEAGENILNIFLEYMPGGSIANLIKRFGGRLEEPTIRRYTRSILLGLEYLHGHNIVHCDIKGGNILVDSQGNVKLADFGASKQIASLLASSGGEAAAKSLHGTPYWMAPEVIQQNGQGTPSDIWSMGCTVIEMASGKPPWSEIANPFVVLYHIGCSNDTPVPPTELSPAGKDFLSHCMQRDPAMRWSAKRLLQHEFVTPAPTPRRSLSSSENLEAEAIGLLPTSSSGGAPLEGSSAPNGRPKSSPRARRAATEAGASSAAPAENVDQAGFVPGQPRPGSASRSNGEKPRVELPTMVPSNLKTLRPPSPGGKPLSIAVPSSLPVISSPPSPSSGGPNSGRNTPTFGTNALDHTELTSKLRGPSSLSPTSVKATISPSFAMNGSPRTREGNTANGSPRAKEVSIAADFDMGIANTGRTRASTTSVLPSPSVTLPEVTSPKGSSPKGSSKLPRVDGRLEISGTPTSPQGPPGTFKGTPSRFAEPQPNPTRLESALSSSALPVSPGRTRGSLLPNEERRPRAESAGVLEGNADVASRVRAAIFGGVGGGLTRTQSDQVVGRAGYGRPSDDRLNSTIDGPQHMQKRESSEIGSRLRAAVFGSEKRVSTANDAGPGAKRPSSRERAGEGFRVSGAEEWGGQRRRSSGGEYGTAQETAAALEASWMNGFLSPPRTAGWIVVRSDSGSGSGGSTPPLSAPVVALPTPSQRSRRNSLEPLAPITSRENTPRAASSSGQNTPGGSKYFSNSPHSYASTPHGLPRSAVPSPRLPAGANNVSPLPPLAPPSPAVLPLDSSGFPRPAASPDGDVSKWPRRRSSGLEAVPEVTSSVEHGKAQKVSWRARWRDTIKLLRRPSKRYLLTEDHADSPVSDPGLDALATPPAAAPARRSSSAGAGGVGFPVKSSGDGRTSARARDTARRRSSAVRVGFGDENDVGNGPGPSGAAKTRSNQILIPGMDGNEIVMGWGKSEDGLAGEVADNPRLSGLSDASTSERSSRVSRQSRRTTRSKQRDSDASESGVNTLPIVSDEAAGSSATETESERTGTEVEKKHKKLMKRTKRTKSSRLLETDVAEPEGTVGRKSSVLEKAAERRTSSYPPEAPVDTGFDRTSECAFEAGEWAWTSMGMRGLGHSGSVNCMTEMTSAVGASAKGDWIVTGGVDHNLMVWDMHVGTCAATLRGHSKEVECVAAENGLKVDSHGPLVASGSAEGAIRLWDIRSKTAIKVLSIHKDRVASLVMRSGVLISGSDDGTVGVVDLRHLKSDKSHVMRGHLGPVTAVQLNGGNYVASGSTDRTIRLWEINPAVGDKADSTVRARGALAGHLGRITALAMDDTRVASGSSDYTIKVWATAKSAAEPKTLVGHTKTVNALAMVGSVKPGMSQLLLSASADKTVKLWDLATGKCTATGQGHSKNITCLASTAKGLAITGGADKALRTWAVQKTGMRQLAVLEKHGAPITCCHVGPSGWAVSADKDGVVCLWKPGQVV